MDIKELFDSLHSERYNFKGLYQFIIDNEIPIEFVNFRVNAAGMASYDKIYISNRFINIDYDVLFMVISHEIGHFLSYRKFGIQYHLDRLSSSDWDLFYNHVIHEEILADKFSYLLYYKLNKHVYTGYRQRLHLKERQIEYAVPTKATLFRKYTNNIDDYQRAVESLIYS